MSRAGAAQDFPRVVRITSETANVATIRRAVEEAAERIGFSAPEVSAIALAIDEAVANVIRHGYAGRGGQPIEVTIDRVDRGTTPALEVTLCDCGQQVDPTTIVGRRLDEVRPGGLGTHIIRSVMDEVEYTHRQPTGMRLRLLKKLGLAPAPAADRQTSRTTEGG